MYRPQETTNDRRTHEDRVSNLGRRLKGHIENNGFFVTNRAFLVWAGKVLQCNPDTVAESLKETGLWRGPDPCGWTMELMQERIVQRWFDREADQIQ